MLQVAKNITFFPSSINQQTTIYTFLVHKHKVTHTWDPGFGVLHFLILQTVLNEKFKLPHLGHAQSLSRAPSESSNVK